MSDNLYVAIQFIILVIIALLALPWIIKSFGQYFEWVMG